MGAEAQSFVSQLALALLMAIIAGVFLALVPGIIPSIGLALFLIIILAITSRVGRFSPQRRDTYRFGIEATLILASVFLFVSALTISWLLWGKAFALLAIFLD